MTEGRPSGLLPALTVAALAFAAFLPSLASPTACVDADGVLSIPMLATPRNIPAVFGPDFLFYTEGEYRPLGYALLTFGRAVTGSDRVRFWGAWLVAFHALSAMLVFFIARRFCERAWPAFAAGALFAVHPLASLWAGDAARFPVVVGGLLTLGALACYLRFIRTRGVGAFLASLALFAAALFASRGAWALPPVLLIIELARQRERFLPAAGRFALFALLALSVGLIAASVRPSPVRFVYPTAAPGSELISFYTFIGTAPDFLRGVFVARGFQAPPGEFANNVMSWTEPAFFVSALGALGLMVFAVYELTRRKWLGLGMLLGIAAALPFSSLAFHRVSTRLSWDAWYLVAAGTALALGAVADALAGSSRRIVRTGVAAAAVAWVACFAVMLARENIARRDAVTWWSRVAEFAPRSDSASRKLGEALFAAGRRPEALERLFSPTTVSIPRSSYVAGLGYLRDNELLAATVHFLRAERFDESDGLTRNRIVIFSARLLLALGANDFAEASASHALAWNPWEAAAMNVNARSLTSKGYYRAARRFAERAHEIVPDDPEAAAILARLDLLESQPADAAPRVVRPTPPAMLRYLVGEQRTSELCRMMTALAQTFPEDPLIQTEAGMSLLNEGRPEAARERLATAAKQLPTHPYLWSVSAPGDSPTMHTPAPGNRDAEFWNHMGYLLYQRGSLAEAISCFHAAIDAAPKFGAAHNNLGLVLEVQGKHPEAIECFRAAIRLSPSEPDAWRNLATALLAIRDCAGTLATLEDGLKAVPDDREMELKLAWVLAAAPEASMRSGERAVKLAEEALSEPGARRSNDVGILAAAYAEAGDYDHAVSAAKEAEAMARMEKVPGLAESMAERLACYEKKTPWRMK